MAAAESAASMADELGGDGDEPAQGGDHGLAAAGAWPARMAPPRVAALSWCSQAAMLAASSAPRVQAVFTWAYPADAGGRPGLAVAGDVPCRGAVPVLALHGDLGAVHVDRVVPVVVGDAGQQPPQRRDPLGADREADVLIVGGAGQRPGEVPGVGAQRHPP